MPSYGRRVVEQVLDQLGVDYEDTLDEWARAICPLHADSRPSFGIHMDDGAWICRAGCGASNDLAVLVQQLTGEPLGNVQLQLTRGLVMDEEALGFEDEVGIPPPVQALPQEDLSYDIGVVPQYFFDRGFSKETARDWKVGWDAERKTLVVPVHDDTKVVGLVRRRLQGEPKYQNSTGMHKDRILFGDEHVPRQQRDIVVVEGPLDAMWLHQCGIPAVALFGASMSDTQAQMLVKRYWRIFLLLDADEAGRKGVERAQRLLSRRIVETVELPPERKDAQECTSHELQQIFEEAGLDVAVGAT